MSGPYQILTSIYRITSHIRQVFSTENHCCLSLSKCVNDKIEYKHHRLRRKSKMIRGAQHKRMYHKSILIWSSSWSLLTCAFHLIKTFISKTCDENVHLNVFHFHVHRNDSCQCFKNFNCSKHTNGLFSR